MQNKFTLFGKDYFFCSFYSKCFFGGGVDVLEVLSFNWQNLTYKREQNLARARNFVVCTLIKEGDDKDRLDNDETPKVVISGATNGLIILIINAVNCLIFKRQFFF